jgi:hypothetical protein
VTRWLRLAAVIAVATAADAAQRVNYVVYGLTH